MNIDNRCYDYSTLTTLVDVVFVMAYDERSQIYGECKAWANSAYQTTLKGFIEILKYISQYNLFLVFKIVSSLFFLWVYAFVIHNNKNLSHTPTHHLHEGIKDHIGIGVKASKIVLGVPWYGYDYPCSNYLAEVAYSK